MKNKIAAGVMSVALSIGLLAGCGNAEDGTNTDSSAAADIASSQQPAQDNGAEEKTPGDSASTADSAQEAAAAEVTYPITIENVYGETVIESKPERIVTLGWENQDTALALGVAPVGVSAANYGKVTENNLHIWTDDAFAALGVTDPNVFNDVDGFDYEAISDAQPDVILAAYSGMTEEEYNTLSEIAPVVTFQTGAWQTTWREQTILNAAGMGMEEAGKEKVAEVDALIQEKLAQYPELKGVNTGFFWISPDDYSTFYAYLPTDPRCNFLTDLGLTIPQSIQDLSTDDTAFSVTISRENAAELNDVDIMIVYGDEELLADLQADPLMSTIPAIKNGAVVLLDSETDMAAATTPSILSIPACIDEYLSLLDAAYQNVK